MNFDDIEWNDLQVPYVADDATLISRGERGDVSVELWVNHPSQAETSAYIVVARPGRDRLNSLNPAQWDAITRAVGNGWERFLDDVDLTPYYPVRYEKLIGNQKPKMLMDTQSQRERLDMLDRIAAGINEKWSRVNELESLVEDAKNGIDDLLIQALEWKITPRELCEVGGVVMNEQTMRNRRTAAIKRREK